jgi:hypothetical protein
MRVDLLHPYGSGVTLILKKVLLMDLKLNQPGRHAENGDKKEEKGDMDFKTASHHRTAS